MTIQQSEVHLNFFMILSFITLMQIGKYNYLGTLFIGFFNKYNDETEKEEDDDQGDNEQAPKSLFFYAILLQLLISVAYLAIFIVFAVLNIEGKNSYLKVPHYGVWIAMVIAIMILLRYEEKEKSLIRKQFIKDGRMMSIFFKTKLGLHSPR